MKSRDSQVVEPTFSLDRAPVVAANCVVRTSPSVYHLWTRSNWCTHGFGINACLFFDVQHPFGPTFDLGLQQSNLPPNLCTGRHAGNDDQDTVNSTHCSLLTLFDPIVLTLSILGQSAQELCVSKVVQCALRPMPVNQHSPSAGLNHASSVFCTTATSCAIQTLSHDRMRTDSHSQHCPGNSSNTTS